MDNLDDSWWVISGADLLAALVRVAEGESPDMVYANMYANGETEIHE